VYKGLEDTLPPFLPDFVEICIKESCMVTQVLCILRNIKHIRHTDVLVRS
jgi:hypothetical protein